MTAAAGIVHEEHHSARFAREGGVLEMVQLWVNLPAREKQSPPRYQDISAGEIPTISLGDGAGEARIIAGEFLGATGPAMTFTPLSAIDLRLRAGKSIVAPVPEGHTTLLVVRHGSVRVNDGATATGVATVEFERE
jgi:redox-sensitive bicupin YhaK (pirin superfamily)